MKNVITAALVFFAMQLFGQVTAPNNAPTVGNYVGFNGTSFSTLPIRNDGFPRIDIASNSSNKFRIDELNTWSGLNGLSRTRIQRTTMGLQAESNLAWSMLHLWSGTLPAQMQRSWMNVGTSYTANQDFMYAGLLERPRTGGNNLLTDAVIAWGCQEQGALADNFRFIFLTPSNQSGPAAQVQGREVMRIHPLGNIGIGDFSQTGLDIAPTAKLDIEGDLRIRTALVNSTPEVLIVGREIDAVGDYVLNHLAFTGNTSDVLSGDGTWVTSSGTDCRWQDIASISIPGETDIFTAVNPGDDCYRSSVLD